MIPALKTSAAEPPAAEWRAVSKRFTGNDPRAPAALDRLQLAVRAGEFLTLLGPSGCGKTTALRLLSGLETPDSGRVFLDGEDVTALPPHRRHVNQVFQSYALFPHLSVADNIRFGLRMQRLPSSVIRARTARAAELLALDGLLARRPAALSGGQRQRVALARALVCQPKVLLLDEPLSALDARLRAQVRGELRALQRRLGTTFVFVTHDQEEALTLSDRVAVLHAGRLEQIGTPEEIYARPGSRFVAGFIGEANLLRAELVGGEGCRSIYGLAGLGNQHLLGTVTPAGGAPGKAFLMFRPEHVQLTRQPSLGHHFSAVVEGRTFRGADTTVTLRLSLVQKGVQFPLAEQTGAPVHLLAQLPSGVAETFPVGSPVDVRIDPPQIVVFPDEQEGSTLDA